LGYGDSLLNNPYQVASDANISAQTAAWYWATQYGPGGYGANCHQAISDSNGGGGFGATIWHVNGSLECNGNNTAQMWDRINRYHLYCDRLGCNGYGNNESC
jgi:chitinase